MLASIRSGAMNRCLSTAPVSRSIHMARVLREEKKTAAGSKDKETPATAAAGSKAEPEAATEKAAEAKPENVAAAAAPKAARSAPTGIPGRLMGYKRWLRLQGGAFKSVQPGKTNYVGGRDIPFPLNPAFRPRAPVSDATREAIYKDYLADPLSNTPRVLGEKYGISIRRVEAILKLKAIEHHMVEYEQGVSQKKLTAGMESMLGVASTRAVKERLVQEVTRVSGPRFHAVPEGTPFTAADAAEILGRKPYQQIMDRMTASKPYIIDYEGLDPRFAPRPEKKLSKSEVARQESLGAAEEQVVAKDETLGSRRWKFVFTDIGKGLEMKDRDVLIRDQDGTLKKAGREYKLKRYGQIWTR
ncbi:hypothetical protein GQ54DRAFT_295456 [Martensiomyces pterosporus]|nr:hypothetical protein GQ54DRAFT_295456 [Martensiomyces pterosporus]